jgi:hypothetical protein
LPLLQVSPDLKWLDELIESAGLTPESTYEQLIQRQVELHYQPTWISHPSYQELQTLLQSHPILEGIQQYVAAVDGCASEVLSLLQSIAQDVALGLPPDAPKREWWRFSVAVAQDALAWFRGRYLREPSPRDYRVRASAEGVFVLSGEEGTPFPGTLVDGSTEVEALFFRDLHVRLRVKYRGERQVQALVSRMAQLEVQGQQLTQALEALAQPRPGRSS